nr:MAG TPA: hypothetical protein [Caudoviricetes sp.]
MRLLILKFRHLGIHRRLQPVGLLPSVSPND